MTVLHGTTPKGPKQLVTVVNTSDIVCPFAYLAHRRLDLAVEAAKREELPLEFVFEHRPFMIDCALPTNGSISREDRMRCKFGDAVDAKMELLKEMGKPVGINFQRGGNIGNTIDDHRLLFLAMRQGGPALQHKVLENLYRGYHEKACDNSCLTFLACVSIASGLFKSPDKAKAWLEGDELRAEVEEACAKARQNGVKGVPFVVIQSKGGKLAVCGAQDSQRYLDLFRMIASGDTTKQAPATQMISEGRQTNACVV